MVNVVLFAGLADAAGERVVSLDLPDDATVGAALDRIREEYPAVAAEMGEDELNEGYAVALDGEDVGPSTELDGSTEIAIFPP